MKKNKTPVQTIKDLLKIKENLWIIRRKERIQKMIDKTNEERKQIEKLGFDNYAKRKAFKSFLLTLCSIVILPFAIVLANVFYLVFEMGYAILSIICGKNINRTELSRDEDSRLYREYTIFNSSFKMNKPFLVWTFAKPRWFQAKGLLY